MYIYLILMVIFLIVGVVATVMVMNKKEMKEAGVTQYDTKTTGNWIRLTVIYIVITVIGLAVFGVYIQMSS